MPKVLVIDDNDGVCTALSILLSVHDIDCVSVADPESGIIKVKRGDIDLVIQDMNFSADTTSGDEGVALYRKLRELDADLPIILLTAWTHLEMAVDLVREGAADYLAKPWDDSKLIVTVKNLLELRETTTQVHIQRSEQRQRHSLLKRDFDLCGMVFASAAMHELVSIAARVARSDLPVLITGPNGVGKEKLAQIVQANSTCADGPFITVNAGALPKELIESELFGAEAGAFTGAGAARSGRFEAADGGTLFLDEIGNLPLEGQAKLLRVLQSGEFERLGSTKTRQVNVRVISATNTDLEKAVEQGAFRQDLYYRLNVIELAIPALAARVADILPLAEYFLGDEHQLTLAAESALTQYGWPGNVRELQNCLKRAQLLASDSLIDATDLQLKMTGMTSKRSIVIDKGAIVDALERSGGVIAKAARELGLSRQALYRRMDKFGLLK